MQVIDPLTFLREHPEQYLPGGEVRAYWLAERLAADALLLGASRTQTKRWGDWWSVSADRDWLSNAAVSPTELFATIVPFPEAGVNSMRSEVLLGAFGDTVAISTPAGLELVKGHFDDLPAMTTHERDEGWPRTIMFRAGGQNTTRSSISGKMNAHIVS